MNYGQHIMINKKLALWFKVEFKNALFKEKQTDEKQKDK